MRWWNFSGPTTVPCRARSHLSTGAGRPTCGANLSVCGPNTTGPSTTPPKSTPNTWKLLRLAATERNKSDTFHGESQRVAQVGRSNGCEVVHVAAAIRSGGAIAHGTGLFEE